MKNKARHFTVATLLLLLAAAAAFSSVIAAEPVTNTNALRAGTNFMATSVYSAEDDQRVLTAFEGLRVADVCDGMDAVGLNNRGLMDPEIRPLWRDTRDYRHRFIGIAVTARYVPTQEPAAGQRSLEEYRSLGRQLVQHPFERTIRSPAPTGQRPGHRRHRRSRCGFDRLEQHHVLETQRLRRSRHQCHRA